ncbi:T9SS type A sorting domain-containing protein [Marinirhabdus gelatinilytica]|uniref:Putative secreted protein (Por secretion system target) n=1 Tax=Marinirhabdus gelatinilytica TaxID=1703343 RepID=A0A370Q781_9FLAO|nr:T9SS type A sorting domain-containing protein [Marinirhabdus gelatinilytica]RDK84238.1 putative secreted protein (Por secretion system target) [Marinirhabdus gelatinilytica]
MKKTTSQNLSKKLAKYGALSLAIAGVSNAAGQVVYTDIDPDETIDDTNFEVDMNADGTVDFTIHNEGAGGLAVRIYNDQSNSVLGQNFGGNYNYPTVLNEGDSIGPGNSFTMHPNYQTLNWNSCAYTNSQWCGGQVDKYVGLRFNVGGNQHYGWIQLDVPADASTFTIKGFAFDATPDTEIAAGDQGTLGVDDNLFANFNYFVNNGQLNLVAATAMENISIYSITGQQVANKALSGTNELVDIATLTSGVYLANVTIEGTKKTIKFVKK